MALALKKRSASAHTKRFRDLRNQQKERFLNGVLRFIEGRKHPVAMDV